MFGEIDVDDRVRILDDERCGRPASGVVVEAGNWSFHDEFFGPTTIPDCVRVEMDWPGFDTPQRLWFRRSEVERAYLPDVCLDEDQPHV